MNFWQKEKRISQVQQRFFELKEKIEKIEKLNKEIKNLKEIFSLVKGNEKEEKEIEEEIKKLEEIIKNYQREVFLSGPYDKKNAILTLKSGAGGRDAEDWVALLARMYQRYCQRKGWRFQILDQHLTEGGGPEGRIGIREISLKIKGKYAYGFLKKETGVHRLVRISPFSAKGLRHTSFCQVTVLPEIKIEESEIKINPEDLKIETFRASGPGGQYVNRRESAVRITHLPTGLQAASQAERLQGLNRKIALEILLAKLLTLKEREKEKELEKLKGKKVLPEFGNQIRSYIFHPYQLVKDHRTKIETSKVEEVLDGDLDSFIEAEMRKS